MQNDLRLGAEYLRYDLNTVIAAKPKEEKKFLKDLTGKLFQDISNVSWKVLISLCRSLWLFKFYGLIIIIIFPSKQLDHAAKIKSTPEAQKYYAETVSSLNNVLAKLG